MSILLLGDTGLRPEHEMLRNTKRDKKTPQVISPRV